MPGWQVRFVAQSSNASSTSSQVVVKTKLLPPPPRSEQVLRPELLELLEAKSDRKLTLINAPAGYGKTTLLTHWRRSQQPNLPFAWVSLDKQDNDPVRLWKHIVEALHQVAPDALRDDVLVALSVIGTNLVKSPLPMLVNDLTELSQRTVLVLDDYHWIEESDCHKSVAFFIEHLPDTIHLVLSTRSDLPLALGRLRERNEMSKISAEQLAFSEKETASLLNEKLRLNISPVDFSVLLERTEGWPAGIYLAALSMKQKITHSLIGSLRGSSRYLADLLGAEVLAIHSEKERDFLIQSSVLEEMSGALCDEVLGTEGSSKLLRELTSRNLFVVPLDDGGKWYRFHHLFADFLAYELRIRSPNLVAVLHRRASARFEREGLVESAIRHALAAEEYRRAGVLIARHWLDFAATGQTATLERWLDALPKNLVKTEDALILVKAWISVLHGRQAECEQFLALAERLSNEGPLPDGTVSVESGVDLLRALFGYSGVQSMVEAAERVAELEPKQISPRTALLCLGMGFSLYCAGDTTRARRPLEEGLRLVGVEQPVSRIAMLSALSFVATHEGHLEEAEPLACEAKALADRFSLQEIPQATLAPIALGSVLSRRGDLFEAVSELESALSVRRQFPRLSPWPTLVGLLALASARLAQGNRAEGRAVLAEARAILEPFASDAGIFPELLARQERKLSTPKLREGQPDEDFTERELDVLRLLTGELPIHQMAQSLHIATSTVRTHVRSIYRKLGVSSRREAVEEARARELI
jgi:LuxR family transcriptional regulator, maltose regulon positive regulatory protein